MEINRDRYLKRIIDRKENGMVKVITGIRRLANPIYYSNYLKNICASAE